jgi:uncharacterized membrane protein (DUF106 family)
MIYFIVGFGMGLAVSVPILTLFWLGAHKVAEMKYKAAALSDKVTLMNQKKKVDDSIAKLRSLHHDMTDEQEEEARRELESGKFFQPRERR